MPRDWVANSYVLSVSILIAEFVRQNHEDDGAEGDLDGSEQLRTAVSKPSLNALALFLLDELQEPMLEADAGTTRITTLASLLRRLQRRVTDPRDFLALSSVLVGILATVDSPDAVSNVVDRVAECVAPRSAGGSGDGDGDGDSTSSLLTRQSPLGLFVRKFLLAVNRLLFDGISRLFDDVVQYVARFQEDEARARAAVAADSEPTPSEAARSDGDSDERSKGDPENADGDASPHSESSEQPADFLWRGGADSLLLSPIPTRPAGADSAGFAPVAHSSQSPAASPQPPGSTSAPLAPAVSTEPLDVSVWTHDQAAAVMARIYGEENVSLAFTWFEPQVAPSDIESPRVESKARNSIEVVQKTQSTASQLVSSIFRRQLIIAICFASLQQLSGISAVFYYSSSIFRDAGISDDRVGSLIVNFMNFLPSFATGYLANRFGYRRLLIVGFVGMFVSSVGITIALIADVSSLSVVFTSTYVAFFAASLGPLIYVVLATLFPDSVRGTAVAICICFNWMSNLLTGVTFPYISDGLDDLAFLPFVVALAISVVFTLKMVPETFGKSSDEIQAEFSALREKQRLRYVTQSDTSDPGALFVKYLDFLHRRDYPGALDSLHQYHDIALSSAQLSTLSNAEVSDGSGGAVAGGSGVSGGGMHFRGTGIQYAALNLAGLHIVFDHHQAAYDSVQEAIRVAQHYGDHICVAFALSWLIRVYQKLGRSKEQVLGLLRSCVDRAKELRLPSLETLAFLSQVESDLLRGPSAERPSASDPHAAAFLPAVYASHAPSPRPLHIWRRMQDAVRSLNAVSSTLSVGSAAGAGASSRGAFGGMQPQLAAAQQGSASFQAEQSENGGLRWLKSVDGVLDHMWRLSGKVSLASAVGWQVLGHRTLGALFDRIHLLCFQDAASACEIALSVCSLAACELGDEHDGAANVYARGIVFLADTIDESASGELVYHAPIQRKLHGLFFLWALRCGQLLRAKAHSDMLLELSPAHKDVPAHNEALVSKAELLSATGDFSGSVTLLDA
ncbi:hypothetical protein PybrP1_006736, partial [[Pythium] brassicae (nom. inval.)]